MYRNGPLSKNYVPKWYVPKVSCTDMDLPHFIALMVIQVETYFVTSATLNGIWCIVTVSDLQQQQQHSCYIEAEVKLQ